MKWTLFSAAAIAIGSLALPVDAPALSSNAILNTPDIYIEAVTLAPGEGTGQHSIVPAEVGIVVEGDVILSSPQGREPLQIGKAFALPGLTPHDIRNEGNRPAKVYVIAVKRCD
jgi:quercetin dioxygenase-like cupin family protein